MGCRYQRDVAKVVPLGDHLGAHQHIDLACMHAGQLRFERAPESGGVGIYAGDAHRPTARPLHMDQQFGQMFFQPLGAAPDRRNVDVAAGRAGARYALGKTAVVAAQRAVDLVKNPVGAAMRTLAFPAAVVAGQHRGIAAPVQKNQRLLAARDPFGNGVNQHWRNHAMSGLEVHVHAPYTRQPAAPVIAQGWISSSLGSNPQRHGQQLVFASEGCLPAFQGRGGGPEHDPTGPYRGRSRAFQPGPVYRQIAGGVAGPFLLLVARVVLFVDQNQP